VCKEMSTRERRRVNIQIDVCISKEMFVFEKRCLYLKRDVCI